MKCKKIALRQKAYSKKIDIQFTEILRRDLKEGYRLADAMVKADKERR